MSQNDREARQGLPATTIAEPEISTCFCPIAGAGRYVPALVIVVPMEGRVRAAIRGCNSEEAAISMRAWLASAEPDTRQLGQVVRRILERQTS